MSRNKGASVFKTKTKPTARRTSISVAVRSMERGHGHRVTINFGTPEEETIYVRDNDGVEYDVRRKK